MASKTVENNFITEQIVNDNTRSRKLVPKVAVVIVTHNGEPTLEVCLERLRISVDEMYLESCNHEGPSVDLIIIDNASSDGTCEILKESAYGAFKNIQLQYLEKNIGFGQGNNEGIRAALSAGADFIYLLNQDAYVEPGTLSTLTSSMMKNPEFGVLSPLHLSGNGSDLEYHFVHYGLMSSESGKRWLRNRDTARGRGYISRDCRMNSVSSTNICANNSARNSEKNPEIFAVNALNKGQSFKPIPVSFVNAAAWMVRRQCFEQAGGFHPAFFMYSEDIEFLQRAHASGFRTGVDPSCAVIHDRSANIQKERDGRGLKNDPLRVWLGDALVTALQPEINPNEKRRQIRAKKIRFMSRSLAKGRLSSLIKGHEAANEALKWVATNSVLDAKESLFGALNKV